MKICIDAGHYQYTSKENANIGLVDFGAVSTCGTKESDITIAVADILEHKLRGIEGIDVIRTHRNNEVLTWDKRISRANAKGVDLVLSLHCNSYNSTSTGIETLVSRHADNHTLEIADLIHYSAMKASTLKNRGVKLAPKKLAILDDTVAPAMLIEMGFLSNPKEENLLKSKNWQNDFSTGVVRGLIDAFKISLEPETPVEPKPTTVTVEHKDFLVNNVIIENMSTIMIEGTTFVKVRDLSKCGVDVGYSKGRVTLNL